MDQIKIVCGGCQCEPDVVSNADGKSKAVCPNCGATDNVEDALRIAEHDLAQQAALAMQVTLGGAMKRSKVIKFEPEGIPERTFKWHFAAL